RAGLPLIGMDSEKAQAAKARAIDAGSDYWLAKPILLRELVQRVEMLLEKRKGEGEAPAALSGSMRDLGLLDVFQSLENWKKSGVLRCESQAQVGRVWVQ